MILKNIETIQANAGFSAVYDMEDLKELEVGSPVIAWRVETYEYSGSEEFSSVTTPIVADGDAGDNCVGVQNPDGTVTIFGETTYETISEANQKKYPRPRAL